MLTAEQIRSTETWTESSGVHLDGDDRELDRLVNGDAVLVQAADVLGQREVAEALGVDRSTVLRWLREGVMPEPWARLRTGPLWLSAAVDEFKRQRAAE